MTSIYEGNVGVVLSWYFLCMCRTYECTSIRTCKNAEVVKATASQKHPRSHVARRAQGWQVIDGLLGHLHDALGRFAGSWSGCLELNVDFSFLEKTLIEPFAFKI